MLKIILRKRTKKSFASIVDFKQKRRKIQRMNLWDHDKLYKDLYKQRKRKLRERERVGELGKKRKEKKRERVDLNFNLVL